MTPQEGPFPPSETTSMTVIIPSYLYDEYTDDDDLQAFVSSQNNLAQAFLNTINSLNLPIYTNDNIVGGLLDWVGAGLYGLPRPPLSSDKITIYGELNTWELNTVMLNDYVKVLTANVVSTSDDAYKRILTWAFFKGDGKYFTVRWLKRRIMRFIMGTNGTSPNIDQTYQISVTFGSNNTIAIKFIDLTTEILGAALLDAFMLNGSYSMLNDISIINTNVTPLPYRQLFKDAVDSGALELPFQYTWDVQI